MLFRSGALCLLCVVLIGTGSCLSDTPHAPFSKVISAKQNGLSKTYMVSPQEATLVGNEPTSRQIQQRNGPVSQVKAGLRSTFLPAGYPKSTPPGYLSYSIWSWIQDLSTQLRGVLATQRVLEGVGVGREGATALSALLNFIVRDGCGMAANLIFTAISSSKFSADVKRWRLFADLMVDLGITLEVAATIVPTAFFLPMISTGNMCKAICGVAAGAVGGVFNLHWAKGSNIADIQAKFGAQHTVTGSIGLVFAALFARSVSQVTGRSLWSVYLTLTVLHIYANMQCMKLIVFESLNTSRMNILVQQFLTKWNKGKSDECVSLMSPKAMARKEPLFFLLTPKAPSPRRIVFGESFERHLSTSHAGNERVEELIQLLLSEQYVVSLASNKKQVLVSISKDATPREKAKAYLHAVLLGNALSDKSPDLVSMVQLDCAWPAFQNSCLAAGWDLDKTELQSLGYELSLA